MTFEAALLQKNTDSWTASWSVLCGCWARFCMLSRPCDLGHVQRDHHGEKCGLTILNTWRESKVFCYSLPYLFIQLNLNQLHSRIKY